MSVLIPYTFLTERNGVTPPLTPANEEAVSPAFVEIMLTFFSMTVHIGKKTYFCPSVT